MSIHALALATLLALPAAPGLVQDGAKPRRNANPEGMRQVETAAKGDHARLLSMLGPVLEKADGSTVPTKEALEGRSRVVLYFSASWCGPCRAFTPALVKYAKEHKDAEDFTIILVGSDRTAASQQAYMKKSGMPFLAVPYTDPGARRIKQTLGGSGIPNLVILDAQGNVVKGSYESDGKYTPRNRGSYIGPKPVLQKLEALRKAEGPKG